MAEKILAGKSTLIKSENDYDWLGQGMYFWESNPVRALSFAQEQATRRKSKQQSAVIGAAIDLGYCLDLSEEGSITLIKEAHDLLIETLQKAGSDIPENVGPLHRLDCAVVEFLHERLESQDNMPFDSVRGIFIEGRPVYPESAFHDKTHVQLCIRKPDCIRGYFRPQS